MQRSAEEQSAGFTPDFTTMRNLSIQRKCDSFSYEKKKLVISCSGGCDGTARGNGVTLIKCNKIHLKTTNKNTTVITMHHIRKVMRVLLACIIKNQEIACHIKSEHVFPQKNRKRYTVVITAL